MFIIMARKNKKKPHPFGRGFFIPGCYEIILQPEPAQLWWCANVYYLVATRNIAPTSISCVSAKCIEFIQFECPSWEDGESICQILFVLPKKHIKAGKVPRVNNVVAATPKLVAQPIEASAP